MNPVTSYGFSQLLPEAVEEMSFLASLQASSLVSIELSGAIEARRFAPLTGLGFGVGGDISFPGGHSAKRGRCWLIHSLSWGLSDLGDNQSFPSCMKSHP